MFTTSQQCHLVWLATQAAACTFRQLVFRLFLQLLLIGHTLHLPDLCQLGKFPTGCGLHLLLLPLHPLGDRNTYSSALIVFLNTAAAFLWIRGFGAVMQRELALFVVKCQTRKTHLSWPRWPLCSPKPASGFDRQVPSKLGCQAVLVSGVWSLWWESFYLPFA